jgi:type II secretory ATPase GspE/PulE/Tfp pilus assembly ATPase PilB-like protein
MEVADYLLTSSVIGVMAQRLARRVCASCRREEKIPEALRRRVGEAGNGLTVQWRGTGCPHCMGTGYLGRTGLFELMVVDDATRRQILTEPSGPAIRKVAVAGGMVTMIADGISKVAEGVTDLEEIFRVTIEES